MGYLPEFSLIAVVSPNSTLTLHVPAMALRVQPASLGRTCGLRDPSGGLLIEGGLDQIPEPLPGHFTISHTATVPIRMNDQNAVLR